MTWTQAVCINRYLMLYPDRAAGVDVNHPSYREGAEDTCCYCKQPTNIYVRLDPTTVPFPREEKL